MDISSPPVPSAQQDYFGDYAAVVSSQGERRSRRKSRSKIRAYLYGFNNEATQISSDEDDRQATLAGAARDVRRRISRTGSSIMQLQSAKTSTTRLSNASSSRLLVTGSQSSDTEESAMIADQIKERAFHDNLAAQNHVTSPIDEDKHVDSVMAPLRRKSLYTPGLATRNPSDILKKPPQQESNQLQPDHDYYYDPARPKEPPLSQLAALQLGEDGRSTPSNMNYTHLGGLQLGTLRVTNASPIPRNQTPDSVYRSPVSELKVQDEECTVSEGSVGGDLSAAVPPWGGSPLRLESKHESSPQSEYRGNMTPRGTFPFKTPDSTAYMADEYMSEFKGSQFACSDTTTSRGRITTRDPSFEDEALVIPQAEGAAAEMWRQFIDDAEVRHGDHGSQEDAFRKLDGNTPSISESRRLSAPYSTNWRYSVSNEVPHTDSGYGSNASLNANQPLMEGTTVASKFRPFGVAHETMQVAPQSSIEGPGPSEMAKELSQPLPRDTMVASSSTGVKLDHKSRCISGPPEMPQQIPEQGRYSLQLVGPAPQPSTFSVIPQAKSVKQAGPTARSSPTVMRKLQKARPRSQPPPVNLITVQGYRELSQAYIPRVPSIVAARHADRLRQFPLLDHTFPSLDHTTSDKTVSPIGDNGWVYPLPIRFPSPANALEAATTNHSVAPCTTDEGHKRHSGASSKRRESITVQVQDDLWPASDIVRSPSWSEFGGGRRSKQQKRLAKQEKEDEKRLMREQKDLEKRLEKDRKDQERRTRRDENKQKSSRSRSASRTRARSSDRSSRDTMATIADFGTVAKSLSGNPYDIATAMFPSLSTYQNASNWHPHQISSAVSRPRSTIDMDEVAATEFSRARSRARSQSFGRPSCSAEGVPEIRDDVSGRRPRPLTMLVDAPPMPALAAVDLKGHNLDWARNQQMTRSFSGACAPNTGPFNDRGGLPGRPIRPQSIVMDAPPVPALPSAQQVREREVQIIKSRPRSIVIDAPSVPALTSLPTSQQVSGNEEEIESENAPASVPEKLVRPRKTRTSTVVPDIWSSGSLEKKGPRALQKPNAVDARFDTSSSDETPVADGSDVWEAQRQAWRQRRKSAAKSAGEALLRNQLTEIFDNRPAASPPTGGQSNRLSASPRAITMDPQDPPRPAQSIPPGPSFLGLPNPLASHPIPQQQTFEPASSGPSQSDFISDRPASYHLSTTHQTLRPGPSPLASRLVAPEDQTGAVLPSLAQRRASTLTIPRKRIGSGTSTPTKAIDRLIGRYDGGLQYGYEPGCGLGGSAGTRGAKTAASRKSVDVSRGFGLDLSDVPIFVAPMPAR